ncbi:hypothetical protein [Priestia abyssalis]|nr:hypothetical protein [Priestia abyssalis]
MIVFTIKTSEKLVMFGKSALALSCGRLFVGGTYKEYNSNEKEVEYK